MALAQAKELDKYYEEHKKPVGPLHGLPISLKDQLRVKGLETSMGYVAWLGKYDEEDSVLTALLRKAGAVFYLKTSVPQSLMVCETVNNIIGRTLNPRNKNWSCGGSSGGEGANIGFRGGIIGVGTDIGEKGVSRENMWSLTWCQVVPFEFRRHSTFSTVSVLVMDACRTQKWPIAWKDRRLSTASLDLWLIRSQVIPPQWFTISVMLTLDADLKLFLTSVLQEEPWKYDSKVIPMPWRQGEEDAISSKIQSGGLTLGFYNCDGNVS